MNKYEQIDEIVENIIKGINAIENHYEDFTDTEKDDYCYMINNLELLLRIARKN